MGHPHVDVHGFGISFGFLFSVFHFRRRVYKIVNDSCFDMDDVALYVVGPRKWYINLDNAFYLKERPCTFGNLIADAR